MLSAMNRQGINSCLACVRPGLRDVCQVLSIKSNYSKVRFLLPNCSRHVLDTLLEHAKCSGPDVHTMLWLACASTEANWLDFFNGLNGPNPYQGHPGHQPVNVVDTV